MDRRFLTVLGVSLVFALVVSSIFYQMTARSSTHKQEDTDTRDVVVTTRALSVGATIKPADVKIEKLPTVAFPKGGYSKVEEVLDRAVVSNLLIDEPVVDGRLAAKGSGLGLAPVIPVGMRAVTVRVNDVAGVAGFVLPNMHVDVLITGRPPSGSDDMTTTVLQNMLVLAAAQTLQADSRGQAINAPTVTLLATPEQAETLTLAGTDGHIQLVLRNSTDAEVQKTPGRRLEELYGSYRAPAPKDAPRPPSRPRTKTVAVAPAPPPPPEPVVVHVPAPPPPPDEVVVIRGNQRSVEKIPNRVN